MGKKISVIVPVYNAEAYLRECLDSIVNQTLCDLEIICVNDGSTDNSLNILRLYEEQYSNVAVLTQKNSGVSIARNTAIKRATGKYIAFMDSDDYYPSNGVLKELFEAAEESKANVCGGSLLYTYENKIKEATGKQRFARKEKIFFSDYQYIWGFTRYIYKRSMLVDNEILFPSYTYSEDPLFLLKSLHVSKSIMCIPSDVYCCRKGTHYQLEPGAKMISGLKALNEILQLSNKWGYEEICNNQIAFYTSSTVYGKILSTYLNYTDEIKGIIYDIFQITQCNMFNIDTMNCEIDVIRNRMSSLYNVLDKYERIYIYGAMEVGTRACVFLENRGYKITAYTVTDCVKNSIIKGKPVIPIRELQEDYKSAIFLICVGEKSLREVLDNVETLGISNYEVLSMNEIVVEATISKGCE